MELSFRKSKKKSAKKRKIVKLDFLEDDDDDERPLEAQARSKKSRLQELAESEAVSEYDEPDELPEADTMSLGSGPVAKENVQLDREWYNEDESGNTLGDEVHDPFGIANAEYDELKEQMLAKEAISRHRRSRQGSVRANSKKEADEMWENNRMLSSGAMSQTYVDLDFSKDAETYTSEISVHFRKPKFLQGEQSFSVQKDPISAFRDPESDMARFCRKGSELVKQRQHDMEKKKQAREAVGQINRVIGDAQGGDKQSAESAMDPVGNSSSGEKFSKSMQKTVVDPEARKRLPAYQSRDKLLRVIDENQVIVVIGETGSGKTTQLPQFLYEHGYAKRGMICCTQPRRVAAMSVAQRVSDEMGCQLGTKVGFSIRFEDCTSKETSIRFMTDGILLKETLSDPNLMKYSCVIVDEAHERTLSTDIMLGLFREIVKRRLDLKIIITSATMNATKFSNFFGNAPQFTIPGRTFPVDVLYSRTTPSDYVEQCIKTCITIHLTKHGKGDVLVFLTGKNDIETCCEVLSERFKKLEMDTEPGTEPLRPYEILPIYSQMPADLQARVFVASKSGARKFIFATNIAETSLTIDNIKYVVDCGYYKIKIFNAKMGMDSLQVAPISVANANQRSGRAGRTSHGVAYRLYSESALRHEMYPETIPEIQRTNLANTLLLLKSLKVQNILKFGFLDPPPQQIVSGALYELWAMGALDYNGDLTSLGSSLVKYPMEPSLSKLLVRSLEMQCSKEMLTIVSLLSVPNVFYRPLERQKEADLAREKFLVPESDHLTLLNVYTQWKANQYSSKWCTRHFVHYKSLQRAHEIRKQLYQIVGTKKLKSCGKNWDVIRECISTSFYHQAAKLKSFGKYVNLKTGLELYLHPTSALYGLSDLPRYVVYHEVILTTKEYMSYVTEVETSWLAKHGSVFYTETKL